MIEFTQKLWFNPRMRYGFITVAVAIGSIGLWRALRTPSWEEMDWREKIEYTMKPFYERQHPKDGGFTPELIAAQDSIKRNLLQRPNWGEQEFLEISGLIKKYSDQSAILLRGERDRDFDKKLRDQADEDFKQKKKLDPDSPYMASMLLQDVITAIEVRLKTDAPIDPETKEKLIKTMCNLMQHPNAYIQLAAYTASQSCGLDNDPRIKEQMKDLHEEYSVKKTQMPQPITQTGKEQQGTRILLGNQIKNDMATKRR